jgi:hypothetical protein
MNKCGCGEATCVESWEPGCGLGTDPDTCVRCSPEEEAKINAIVAAHFASSDRESI